MTTFLLIRHGMTDAVGVSMAGHLPGVHLNAEGREQAAELPGKLGSVPIAALYASPLERTRETAQSIADARGLRVNLEPRFLEVDFGEWTGRRFADLAADPDWQLYNAVRGVTRPPGGESLLDVQKRAVSAVLDLHAHHPDDVVAVVSHADTLRAVLQYFLSVPIDFVQRVELSPGRISVLQIGRFAPRVLQINGETVPPLA